MARQTKAKQKENTKKIDVDAQDGLGANSSDGVVEPESSGDNVKQSVEGLTEPVVSSSSIDDKVANEGTNSDSSTILDSNADSGVMTDEDLFSDDDTDDVTNSTPSEDEVKANGQSGGTPPEKGRKLIVCYDEADRNKFLQLCQERHLQYDGELILSTEMSSIKPCDEVKFAFTDILKISHHGELVLREAFQIKDEPKSQISDDSAVTVESFTSSDVELTGSSTSFSAEIDNFAALISSKIENKRSFNVIDF